MAFFPIKPPHPDLFRALSAFNMALRLWFFRFYQSFRVRSSQLEILVRRLGSFLLEKKPRLTLLLLALLWLLPGTAQLPLVDRDEPRFAYATQEMLDRADYFVPTFNGAWRFDKPPLVYWWMRGHYLLWGFNNFTARAPAVEAAIICAFLIFGFASRLYNRAVGFWSAFAFLTTLQIFLHGRLCVADMPMMVFILAAQWAAWELLQKPSWGAALAFWLSLALGFATKWLVPLAVTGLGLALTFVFARRWPWSAIKNFKPLTGLALFAVVFLAWGLPAWNQTSGEFFRVGLGEHVFERGVSAFNARSYNPVFYLLSAFVSLLPYLAFVPAALLALRKNFDDRAKYLLSFVLGVYLLFSLAQTQLPHYVLPAFPSLLILTVAYTGLREPSARGAKLFSRLCFGFWTLVFLAVALLILSLPVAPTFVFLKFSAFLLILSLLLMALLGISFARRSAAGILACVLLTPLAFWGSSALLHGQTPAEAVAKILAREGYPPELIATGFEEPSLVSATQAHWTFEPSLAAARVSYEAASSALLVVMVKEYTLESLPDLLLERPVRARRDFQSELLNPPSGRRFRFGGLNLGRFSWVVCEVYLKT